MKLVSTTAETDWREAFDLSWIIAGTILVIMYTSVLIHTCFGNRNSWLVKVTIILLLSSVGSLITGFAFWQVHFSPTYSNVTYFMIELAVGLSIHYSNFGVAHYMIAVRY